MLLFILQRLVCMSTYEMIIDKKNGGTGRQRRMLDSLHAWTAWLNFVSSGPRSKQHFATLSWKNQPWWRFFFWSFFLRRSALCMSTIWYTNRCVTNANVYLRGGARILESAVWQGFISQRHLWVEIWYASLHWSQHVTSTKWDALSERAMKAIIPEKSALLDQIFSCSVPQNR